MTITIFDITQAAIDDANFQWLAGQQSAYPILPAEATDPADLIGHLNLIHRRRIHVFGPEEILFVNRMDAIRRRNLAIDLLSAGPPGLIFANGLAPPPDLLALSQERKVPVLSTELSAAKVIDRVRTYLARALACTAGTSTGSARHMSSSQVIECSNAPAN